MAQHRKATRRQRTQRRGTPADLLVVGLGNPGESYARTRHNAGAWALQELADRHHVRLRPARRTHAATAELRIDGSLVAAAVPSTFMNDSGRAIPPLLRRYGIEALDRLVIVHDELDLGVGTIKLKLGGGMAGNNGLKSIRDHLRSDAFARIRIGIGKPLAGSMSGRDYVLRPPSPAEQPELDRAVGLAVDAIEFLACNDITKAMNRFNGG